MAVRLQTSSNYHGERTSRRSEAGYSIGSKIVPAAERSDDVCEMVGQKFVT